MAFVFGDPILGVLSSLCAQYGRPIDHWTDDGTGNVTPVFVPPLDATDQATFADLTTMATLGLQTLTLAQYQARKADIQGLRAQLTALQQWLALPTGTTKTNNAIAAEQAIGTALTELARIVGAMLKLDLGG